MMRFWLILKLVAVGALSFVILIALFLVDALIRDRQNYRKEATDAIASSYASEQRIVGPLLVQPYRQVISEVSHGAECEGRDEGFAAAAWVIPGAGV